MIGKADIAAIVENYDRLKLRIGMTASHSALDICDAPSKKAFQRWPTAKKDGTKHMRITSKPTEVPQAVYAEAWSTRPSC